jgi:hypothetical protein
MGCWHVELFKAKYVIIFVISPILTIQIDFNAKIIILFVSLRYRIDYEDEFEHYRQNV